MAGKPGERPTEEQTADALLERPGEPERIGPLVLERHVKDDGRALILYTHDRRARS
ncbi:MAG TPA: hypothetical protein VIH92_11765 [Solirubrobacteraceae bacterium]|jgi:hypothetical protein